MLQNGIFRSCLRKCRPLKGALDFPKGAGSGGLSLMKIQPLYAFFLFFSFSSLNIFHTSTTREHQCLKKTSPENRTVHMRCQSALRHPTEPGFHQWRKRFAASMRDTNAPKRVLCTHPSNCKTTSDTRKVTSRIFILLPQPGICLTKPGYVSHCILGTINL